MESEVNRPTKFRLPDEGEPIVIPQEVAAQYCEADRQEKAGAAEKKGLRPSLLSCIHTLPDGKAALLVEEGRWDLRLITAKPSSLSVSKLADRIEQMRGPDAAEVFKAEVLDAALRLFRDGWHGEEGLGEDELDALDAAGGKGKPTYRITIIDRQQPGKEE